MLQGGVDAPQSPGRGIQHHLFYWLEEGGADGQKVGGEKPRVGQDWAERPRPDGGRDGVVIVQPLGVGVIVGTAVLGALVGKLRNDLLTEYPEVVVEALGHRQ